MLSSRYRTLEFIGLQRKQTISRRRNLAFPCVQSLIFFLKDAMLLLFSDKNPDDNVFFRTHGAVDELKMYATSCISVEEELDDDLKIRQRFVEQQMIFVHQTSFQRHLLTRYGNHVCFLDPVYRTVKYPLPLFFLMVKTNVDYQVVATFVVQDENKESTKEALEFIKSWNPEWKPKVLMVDNDSEEILALQEVFTGTSHTSSLSRCSLKVCYILCCALQGRSLYTRLSVRFSLSSCSNIGPIKQAYPV